MALIEITYKASAKKILAAMKKEIKTLTEKIMGKFEEVKQEFETLKADIQTEREEIAAKMDAQTAKIVELERNILEGGTTEERAALIADIKEQQTVIRGIIPNVAPPPPIDETGSGENAGSGEV